MRRVLGIFTVILLSATMGLAQGRDDHDDNAPVQAGYAVVTPVAGTASGTTTGPVVFETFGFRRDGGNSGATQAGVLAPSLTTNAILFVESSGRLSRNLGVAIVNPNSSNVNVNLSLRKNDGSELATTTVSIPSRQQTAKFVTELFPFAGRPSDIEGTLAITSAGSSGLAVSAIGLRFRGANFSTLPVTSLSGTATPLPVIAPGVGGTGAVLLPQFVAGGGWATELVLANTDTSSLTVRVDLFKQDGTPLTATLNGQTASSFMNLTIPAGGVLTLAPRDRNGDDDF